MTRATALAALVGLLITGVGGHAQQAQGPRYAGAMQEELKALGVDAKCTTEREDRAHCIYKTHAPGADTTFEVHAVYSDDTDSVYFYIDRYLSLPTDAGTTDGVLRRLMELNWKLLAAKFEWNASTGVVRLSATMNTDSNFDRRTFRSLVKMFDSIPSRYHAELKKLQAR